MAACYEYGNEPPGPVNLWEYLEQLKNCSNQDCWYVEPVRLLETSLLHSTSPRVRSEH